MGTKRGRRAGGKSGKVTAKKARATAERRRASERRGGGERHAQAATRAPRQRGAERRVAPDRRGTAAVAPALPATTTEPTLLERAERLRDGIRRSKLVAPDPWTYTPKARAWAEQAQELVEEIAQRGGTAGLRRKLEGLTAEVERDRDFQAARRLF